MTPNTSGNKEQDPNRKLVDDWRKAILAAKDLTPGQKNVAMAYSFHFNYDKTNARYRKIWVGAETLSEEVALEWKTVERALKAIRNKGYLKLHGRTGGASSGSNIHSLTFPKQGDEESGAGAWGVRCQGDEESHNSLKDSLNESLKSPTNGHLHDPMAIQTFINEEPQRRNEYINYLATINAEITYTTALESFISKMGDEGRENWGATFKHYLASFKAGSNQSQIIDTGQTMGDAIEEALDNINPAHDPTEFINAWAGNNDRPEEFRKAWEQALIANHEPRHIVAIGASKHVNAKYPRELLAILNNIKKIDRARAVAQYARKTNQ